MFLVDEGAEADSLGVERQVDDLVVLAKADLRQASDAPGVSGTTGQGIDALLARIEEILGERVARAGTASHERQREAIAQAAASVAKACGELGRAEASVELAAEELRTALRQLDFLVGKVDVEAVLDVIFGTFCLGK